MSKLRSVSTAIWSDVWFEELTPTQKLIFIYLFTNEKTNMLGIYEASVKKISFDTSVPIDHTQKALDLFCKNGKIRLEDKYIVIVNYTKHQNYNTNMKKSAIDVFNELPITFLGNRPILKKQDIDNDWAKIINHLGMVPNHLGMVRKREVEEEVEIESKDETEKENVGAIFPWDSENFQKHWEIWKDYKKKEHKFSYKTLASEQASLKELSELSHGMEHIAIAIINQSLAKGWKGFFALKKIEENGKQQGFSAEAAAERWAGYAQNK